MSKMFGVFLCVAIFAVGLSVGVYFSMENVSKAIPDTTSLTKQIQDIVIREVQAEQNEKYNVKEANTEENSKISPYAKLVVEKYFKKCKHTTVDVIEVPKELVDFLHYVTESNENGLPAECDERLKRLHESI